MKRALFGLGAVVAVLLGLGAGACNQLPNCGSQVLHTARFVAEPFPRGEHFVFGAFTVDDTMDVSVNLTTGRVHVAFESEGRAVEQIFDITSTRAP